MVRPPRITRSFLASTLVLLAAAQPIAARTPHRPFIQTPLPYISPPGTCPDDMLDRAVAVHLPLARELVPGDGYPRSIDPWDEWTVTLPSAWTSGFFAGVLWQLYDCTGEQELLAQATRWTDGLRDQTAVPSHDIGLIIGSSFGRGHLSTGSEPYRKVMLEAARNLAARFDPRVGAIRSWAAYTYPVVIDNMMNLEILFWASRNGGSDSLAQVAAAHAATTARDHVRPDGTTYHVVDYDPESGDVLWRGTVQGLSDTSTWARGQAWGIYGFTVAYRETGEPLFLETACRVADAFLERLPDDWVPCWDFDAACLPGEPKDASAAAVAASGLWELASLVDDWTTSRRYRWASTALVDELSSDGYSATREGLPALLLHSTGNRPRHIEVDVPTIYAEYYFVEALIKQWSAPEPVVETLSVLNAPNPFRSETCVYFEVPVEADVTVRVYDVAGRLVKELARGEPHGAGPHATTWRGRDAAGRHVSPGVYFLRLQAGEHAVERKIALLR